MEMIKNKARSWLDFRETNPRAIVINKADDLETYFIKNRIWYRGESSELSELYKQLNGKDTTFWGSVPSSGMEIKKSHSGLPKLMIHTLTNIVVDNFSGIKCEDLTALEEWNKIEEENKFYKLTKTILNETQAIGDGAIKFSFNKEVSDYPIIEWYTGEKVDFVYKHGRLIELIFKTYYDKENKKYTLKDHRGYGYVKYELLDENNEQVSLNILEDTKELKNLFFDKSTMWAVPFFIEENDKFKGRGSSKFDGKYDVFDSLDEVISQWIEAIRLGKTIRYIPELLCPKDPTTGETLKSNPYDNQYILTESDMSENGNNKIQVEQANIPSEKYLESYITYLGMAIQGIISAATLGIDVKKLEDANAKYERQLEKTTLYTRQGIIEAYKDFLEKVINTSLKMTRQLKGKTPGENIEFDILFGEYDSPSFDSQIDTISKAKINGVMSTETAVEELYGDTKDKEWKYAEVLRIKEEQGIVSIDEPSVSSEINTDENNEITEEK